MEFCGKIAIMTILSFDGIARYLVKPAFYLGIFLCTSLAALPVHADDEKEWHQAGLLRARDLTPFGLQRLDMMPVSMVELRPGAWAFEADAAYQNTFVMSRNVRDYLQTRGTGRIPLRPQDATAINALPGDAYYFDGEVALYDFVVRKKLTQGLELFATASYIGYGRTGLDQTIEDFHSTFHYGQQGRDLVARNQFQTVYKIGDARITQLDRATLSGWADPVIGARLSLPDLIPNWNFVLEGAAKISVDGDRFLLSTGRNDYGMQAAIQHSWGRQALNASLSAVYVDGSRTPPNNRRQVVPTVVLGYGFGVTRHSTVVLQAYASRSTVRDTNLEELRDNKYQASLGLQARTEHFLWSVAITENVSNFNNTPDIGAQLNLTYFTHPSTVRED